MKWMASRRYFSQESMAKLYQGAPNGTVSDREGVRSLPEMVA
jgi:hypothetical protein